MDRFTKAEFTSGGTWTCPAGVTKVMVQAMGGGSGGNGGFTIVNGSAGQAGVGGNAVWLQTVLLDVVPNTTYTITIGAGGTSGPATSNYTTLVGGTGGDTSFGALMTWKGALPNPVPTSGFSGLGATAFGPINYTLPNTLGANIPVLNCGGTSGAPSINLGGSGYPGLAGLVAAPGTTAASGQNGGNGGGGATGESIGGNGGNGGVGTNGTGSAGASAAANSGAGGGGGGSGGGGAGTGTGGAGGVGGSGKLIVYWVE